MAQLGSSVVNGSLRVNGDLYAENVNQTFIEESNPINNSTSAIKNGDVWVGGANSGSDVPVSQTDVQKLEQKIAATNTDVQKLDQKITSRNASINTTINNKDTVTSYTIPTIGWTSGTDGSASVYVYSISLNNVYVNVPDVWYAGNSSAMSLAYSKLYKVTVDKDAKKLKLYSVAVPGSSYVICVRGVN